MRSLQSMLLVLMGFFAAPVFAQQTSPSSTCQSLGNPITSIRIGDNPWLITATRDNCWIFVSVGGGANAVGKKGIAVLRRSGDGMALVHFEPMNARNSLGQTRLTHDEKILLVGGGTEIVFFDAAKLKAGQQGALLGSIHDQRFNGAGSLVITSDDRYVFISQRNAAWVSIIDLKKARETSFAASAIVGGIPVGPTPTLLLSPDERYLYVSSTETVSDWSKAPTCKATPDLLKYGEGAIFVIDVQRATTNPSEAIISTVSGSCRPGGIAISPDGNTLYETSTEEKVLLAFDTRPVREGRSPALLGKVPVPESAGSLAVVDAGRKVFVANANPFGGAHSNSPSFTVIDASRVSSGSAAILGRVDTEYEPTNLTLAADGRSLLVTNRAAGTVQVLDVQRLQLQR